MTSSNTKLNILLNNTNKALVQVLLDATKDDLKSITKDTKDLRSIMDKVIKQTTSGDSSSNKAMLDLVKKNPTLNNLGSPSTTIKELINTIKSDKNPLPVEKVLKDILIDIKDIKNIDIKPKLNNSGVFLESKIKNITNPQVELKNTLTDLKEVVKQSSIPQAKEVLKKVEVLLKDNIIKTATNTDLTKDAKQNPKLLDNLSREVKSLVDKVEKIVQKADVIYTSKTKEILSKLEFATNPSKTKLPIDKSEPIANPQQAKASIDKLEPAVNPQQAKTPIDKTELIKPQALQTHNKEEIKQNSPPQQDTKQKVTQPLNTQNIETMKISSNKLETVKVKVPQDNSVVLQTANKTKLVDDGPIKLPIVKETLQALQSVLDKSLILESKTVLKAVTSALATLEVTKEVSKELKQDIFKLINDTNQIVKKADVVYSKDMLTIFSKLQNLSSQNSLNTQANIKEMLSNDLKATLLQTTSELESSSHPNKNDLIKQMDKLVLQIDHYQLISHLNNGTSVYLPISWESLEGGDIEIKKDNDKFYCDIELQLKEYGDVSLKLTLFEKNQLNINVYSPNQDLKELFHKHISILRVGMISSQIIPREIRFHDGVDKSSSQPYKSNDDEFNIGFEVKG